jgi:pyruvate formate lyase activating enzyme
MAAEHSGMIFDVRRFSIHDGPGIRTTVFFKGCPLSCWWCHNPESQRLQKEIMIRTNRCIHCGKCYAACPQGAIFQRGEDFQTNLGLCVQCGTCVPTCPADAREIVGRQVSVDQLMAEIKRDLPFFEESGGGVTISGGEPLMQPRFLMELLKSCQREEIHIALDTSGYAPWTVLKKLVGYVDLFLYDIKIIDDQDHRKYTGVSNELILSNLERLAKNGASIILRVPVIPGINDTERNLNKIARLAQSLPGVQEVDLLPYHRAAEGKYSRLNRDYQLDGIEPASEERVNGLVKQIKACGLFVKIGG